MAAAAQSPEPGGVRLCGRLAASVLRWRLPILIAALGLTAFLGWHGARLRSEWNEQQELPAGDPEISASVTVGQPGSVCPLASQAYTLPSLQPTTTSNLPSLFKSANAGDEGI